MNNCIKCEECRYGINIYDNNKNEMMVCWVKYLNDGCFVKVEDERNIGNLRARLTGSCGEKGRNYTKKSKNGIYSNPTITTSTSAKINNDSCSVDPTTMTKWKPRGYRGKVW